MATNLGYKSTHHNLTFPAATFNYTLIILQVLIRINTPNLFCMQKATYETICLHNVQIIFKVSCLSLSTGQHHAV